MKVLAILRPALDGDIRGELRAHADAELRTLWRLYAEGVVREVHSPGGPGSVMIFEAASRDAAAEQLHTLPLVANGIMTLELIELHPFTALQMLFGERPGEV